MQLLGYWGGWHSVPRELLQSSGWWLLGCSSGVVVGFQGVAFLVAPSFGWWLLGRCYGVVCDCHLLL